MMIVSTKDFILINNIINIFNYVYYKLSLILDNINISFKNSITQMMYVIN